jgi:hypothetical protein
MQERRFTPEEQVRFDYAETYGEKPEIVQFMGEFGPVRVFLMQSNVTTRWATYSEGEKITWHPGVTCSIREAVNDHLEYFAIDPEEGSE